jgi:hypothetical protein
VRKIGVVGDLHISARSRRTAHVLEVLDWVIEDGQKRGVTDWVLAGDLVEGSPSGSEEEMLVERLVKMRSVGVCLGNHEAKDAFKWLPYFPGVTFAGPTWAMMDLPGGVAVQLIPYPWSNHPPFDDLQYDGTIDGMLAAARMRLASIVSEGRRMAGNRPHIIVGHFTIESMVTRDTAFEVHSAREVIATMDMFGHDAALVGVGGLVRHDFSEAEDPKSYTIVAVDDDAPALLHAVLVGHIHKQQVVRRGTKRLGVSLEQVLVPARQMMVLTVSSLEELNGLENLVAGQEVKITVEMRADQKAHWTPDVFTAIADAAAELKIDPHVQTVQRVRAPEIAKSDRLADQVIAWLDATDQSISAEQRERLRAKAALVEAR